MITVARIEADTAVVYFDSERRNIPMSQLPDGTREGSVLVETPQGLELDLQTEQKRRKELSDRMKKLFR